MRDAKHDKIGIIKLVQVHLLCIIAYEKVRNSISLGWHTKIDCLNLGKILGEKTPGPTLLCNSYSGFVHLEFGDLEALTAAINDKTCAVMIEPIQGEGGIRPLPDAFLKALRELCDEHGILMILDEVQCGVGRTGKLFAHEWAGVTPDIMMIAKGIGGGFPLGAVLATENAASGMTAGTHGSTYGGNPLGCAVGSAVMDVVADPEFLSEVNRKAGLLRQKLEGLVASHPDV